MVMTKAHNKAFLNVAFAYTGKEDFEKCSYISDKL